MVYWFPTAFTDGEPFLAAQLDQTHTTVAVGFYPEHLDVHDPDLPYANLMIRRFRRTSLLQRLGTLADGYLQAIEATKPVALAVLPETLLLAPSPWKRSWTFGVGGWQYTKLSLFMSVMEQTMRDMGFALRARRELHASWR